MIHDQPCCWGVVTYSLLCVVTVTAKDRCFQHWGITGSGHSQTAILIRPIGFNAERFIHLMTLSFRHELNIRFAACKEARYLLFISLWCFYQLDLWQDHFVFDKHASRPTVQCRSWDGETAMIGVAVKLQNITFQPVEDADAQNNFNEKYMRSGFENSLSPGHHDIWGINRVCVCQALSSLDITDISYSTSLPYRKMTQIHRFWIFWIIMFSNVMYVLMLSTVLLFRLFSSCAAQAGTASEPSVHSCSWGSPRLHMSSTNVSYMTSRHIQFSAVSINYIGIVGWLCAFERLDFEIKTDLETTLKRHLDRFTSDSSNCQVVPAPGRWALHWKLGGPKLAGSWGT